MQAPRITVTFQSHEHDLIHDIKDFYETNVDHQKFNSLSSWIKSLIEQHIQDAQSTTASDKYKTRTALRLSSLDYKKGGIFDPHRKRDMCMT